MNLTLEQKVGQVFMFGFPSKDPAGAEELIKSLHAGGIIYFARNLDTVGRAAALSETLQGWALSSPPGIPLLVAADQEGGIVARFTKGIPLMPGPMSLAAASASLAQSGVREPVHDAGRGPAHDSLVRRVHHATGIQLRAAGVNMNLAPDLDVNDNPDNPVIGVRSFGGDPELVSRLGTEAVQGLLSAGVLPVGKHFPGHGNTSVDSHLDLPVLPHSMERLHRVELAPFRAAIAGGLQVIMTAHIVFLAVDPDRPATVSERVLQGLLRRELGFQGLIITDCMEMAAIAKSPGTVRGAVLALKAGADMVLVSHTKELQVGAYEAVLEAVRSGELPESRLDEAVERILAIKRKVCLPNPLSPEEATRHEFWTLSKESHLASITVAKDEVSVLPLRKVSPAGGPLRLLLAYPRGSADSGSLSPLGQTLAQEGVVVSEVYLEATERRDDSDPTGRLDAISPTGPQGNSLTRRSDTGGAFVQSRESNSTGHQRDNAGLLARAREASVLADAVVILTRNAASDKAQACGAAAMAQEVAATGRTPILVATGNPHDIRVVPGIGTYVCTYSHRPEAMAALAQILLGHREPVGRAPVDMV